MTRGRLLCVLLAGATLGCATEPPTSDPDVVAVYDGGEVRRAEVDRAILSLPAEDRQPPADETGAWYGDIARRVALEEILAAEARAEGLDARPELRRERAEARKLLLVRRYLEERLPPVPAPGEDEVRAFYAAHADEYARPPRRLLRHVFLRRPETAGAPQRTEEALELRRRALAGVPFAEIATSSSDSESRHQEGLLGWTTPGVLPPELERIVFALEPGVPSEPVTTAEGVHVFLVEEAVEARRYSLEEVRPRLVRRLREEARRELLDEALGDELPPGSFVPRRDELAALLASGDPRTLILRVGDYELRLEDLQEELLRAQARGAAPAALDDVVELVEDRRMRELAHREALAGGLTLDPAIEAELASLEDRALASARLRELLGEALEGDAGRLAAFYDRNRRRYSTPLRLRLTALTVPLTATADRDMARLEALERELENKEWTLEEAAAELGATLEDLGWQTLAEIQRRSVRAGILALGLEPGGHSPPYRTQNGLELLYCAERENPRPLPYDEARSRVVDDLLAQSGAALVASLQDEVLRAARFRLVTGAVERLATGR